MRLLAGLVLLLVPVIPVRADDQAKGAAQTSWEPGKGLKISVSNFQLNIGARLQIRASDESQEYCGSCRNALAVIDDDFGPTTGQPTGLAATGPRRSGNQVTGRSVSDFNLAVRRFKLYLQGWAFDPRFKFDLQYETESGTGNSNTGLREAAVDLQLIQWLGVKAGQWKGPLGRQRVTSDGNQKFVDLSIATDAFAMGFEDGVMVHGLFGGEKKDLVEYNIGVFNGKGLNPPLRGSSGKTDHTPLYAARVVINPFGEYGYSESAIDNPPDFRLYVGAAFNRNTTESAQSTSAAAGSTNETRTDRWGGELGAKYRRFSFEGEYFRSKAMSHDAIFGPATPPSQRLAQISGSQFEARSDGYFAQFGVFAIAKTLEFALRASAVDNGRFEHDVNRETRLGVNWFISKSHPHKLQFDVGKIDREFNESTVGSGPLAVVGAGADDHTVTERQTRVQYQFWF